MLVETKKKGDVVSVKLTTSEEIIGSFEDEDNDHYMIDRPFMVGITQQGIALMPWLQTVDVVRPTVKINKKHLVAIAEPVDSIAKQYSSQMSCITLA